MIQYIKENYKITLISIIYGIMTYSLYFNAHYVHDSYRIYNFGFLQNLKGLWTQGRPISMWFNILFNFLNISPRIGQIISIFLTIIFLGLSCTLIYSLITKRLQNNSKLSTKNKIIILIACIVLFFNVYITEWMMFFESCIIALGCLLSIIGIYLLLNIQNNYKKYLLSSLFLILGIFCYQSSIALAGAIIVLLTIYDNKKTKIFDIIKKVILNMLPYILALICNFAFVKLVNLANTSDARLSGNIDILYNIKLAIVQSKWYFIDMFNFPTKNIFAILIIFTFIYYIVKLLLNKQSKIYILYISISLFSLWFLSILPILAMPSSSIYFMSRSVPYIASIFPLLLLCIYLFDNNDYLNNKLLYILLIIYTIISTLSVIKVTSECLRNNIQDIDIARTIQNKIDEYEKNTNNVIDTIILVPDSDLSLTEGTVQYYGDNSSRTFSAHYGTKEIMYFVSKRNYNVYQETISIKEKLFGDLEWECFSLEQLKFENNILYLVNY